MLVTFSIVLQLPRMLSTRWPSPVPTVVPSLFCLTLISVVFLGCAAYEVYEDTEAAKRSRPSESLITFEDVVVWGDNARAQKLTQPWPRFDPHYPTRLDALWDSLPGTTKMLAAIAALNGSIYAFLSRAPKSTVYMFKGWPPVRTNRSFLIWIRGRNLPPRLLPAPISLLLPQSLGTALFLIIREPLQRY